MDEIQTVWNVLLTLSLGVSAYFLKSKANEVDRIQILLNKTREEIAKEYVTKQEAQEDINRVLSRLDNIDLKIDRLIERQK
tara:strand:- start:1525 stop:1767 length:243 start_codon:yes stop_codon:yes gene_type:complete